MTHFAAVIFPIYSLSSDASVNTNGSLSAIVKSGIFAIRVIVDVSVPAAAIHGWVALCEPCDIGVIVASGIVVEVTIRIKLLASELAGIIACPRLRTNSTKDKEGKFVIKGDKVAIRCVPLRCR